LMCYFINVCNQYWWQWRSHDFSIEEGGSWLGLPEAICGSGSGAQRWAIFAIFQWK